MRELCPVCHRVVAVSDLTYVVFAHHDKAHNSCPMGGHALGGEKAA